MTIALKIGILICRYFPVPSENLHKLHPSRLSLLPCCILSKPEKFSGYLPEIFLTVRGKHQNPASIYTNSGSVYTNSGSVYTNTGGVYINSVSVYTIPVIVLRICTT